MYYNSEDFEIKEFQEVKSLEKTEDDLFKITTLFGEEFLTKTVIVATGGKRRKLPVKGADIFEHKGLTYCASCDGPVFTGKDVVVIGGGNSAFESASQLMAYCKSVTIINRGSELRAEPTMVENVLSNENVKVIKNANSNRDIIYDVRKAVAVYFNLGKKRNVQSCQPQNNWDVSYKQKPLFTIHRLQLGFHILSQSQPFTTNVKSFIKTYNPRGWTGYIYLLGNVRIRALPHKVIAELTEDIEFDEQITPEEAVVRVIDMLKSAVEEWLKELSEDGFELELSHPYVMNAPEFAFKSRLVKQYIKKLREQQFIASCIYGLRVEQQQQELDIWIDDSPAKTGEGEYAHIETNDCDTANIVDKALKNIAHINEYMKKIDIVVQDIQNVKILMEGGLNIQQQIQQLMSVVAYLLKKDAEREALKKENEELRKRIEKLEKELG